MGERGIRVRRLVASLGAVLLLTAIGPVPGGAATPPGPTGRAASDRCYIEVSHQIFLDRPASAAEVQSWSDRFDAGDPRYRLPQALATSDEWLTVVVTGLYQDALDRDPDAAGRAHWIGQLRAGALVNRVASQIYGSSEFYARAGGTTRGFVTDIYTRILHRAPDASGQAYWEGRVATLGRGRVAAAFFASVESRGDRVDTLYDQILGRPSDSTGRTYWIGQLATVNDVRLAVLLASSPELVQRAAAGCIDITRITDGEEGSDGSGGVSISADGRRVAFWSDASGLVPGDSGRSNDIFTWDAATGITRITDGTAASFGPTISPDGTLIAYSSVDPDMSYREDLFLWDRTTGSTTRITDGDGPSYGPSISADGTTVAFTSSARDLVPDDPNGQAPDVYLWDRASGSTSRIDAGNGYAARPSLSADGKVVVFESGSTDLVPGDANGQPDLFLWDRTTDSVTRITDGDRSSSAPSLSDDGRSVAFSSSATDLVPGDTNGQTDVFLWDRTSGRTIRITDGDGYSIRPDLSADGQHVTFTSEATDLVPGDANDQADIFTWHRATGTTTRVTDGDRDSWGPASTSADGTRIAFSSAAGDLVPGDDGPLIDVFVATIG